MSWSGSNWAGDATNLSGDLLPAVDNTLNVGSDARRFSRVRAAAVVSGDLGFDDESCLRCRRKLAPGDRLALQVVRAATDTNGKLLVYAVPVHTRCDRAKGPARGHGPRHLKG